MVKNLIVVSDLHCNSRLGLCPPKKIKLDMGGTYEPSTLQKKVWKWWEIFWRDWVPMVTRGEPFAVCVNGDSVEGKPYNSKTSISDNLNDQARLAEMILDPIKRMCARDEQDRHLFFMTRGTEAHVGKSAEEEERIAENLGTIPDNEGCYARNRLWIRLGGEDGCLVDVLHHIGTTSSAAYETTALLKEYTESCAEAAKWHLPPPDTIIRSHRHILSEVRVPTKKGYGIVVVTPGWQLRTPFSYKIAGGRIRLPQFGGILVRQGDEEHYTRHKVWNITREVEVVL